MSVVPPPAGASAPAGAAPTVRPPAGAPPMSDPVHAPAPARAALDARTHPSTGRVHVLVWHAAPTPDGVEAAYHEVSARMQGVPGLLGNELLRSVHDPTGFIVISTWRDLESFDTWEQGPEHKNTTAPLRDYRDTRLSRPFGIYQVTAAY